MDADKVKEILKRYNEGICSDEEKEWIESWYLKQLDLSQDQEIPKADLHTAKQDIWRNIIHEREIRPARSRLYPKIAVAASILFAIGITFFLNKPINAYLKGTKEQIGRVKIVPGGDKAYLTLSDGQKINLTNIKQGESIEQPGMRITKTTEGQLVYVIENTAASGAGYNTIETPVGGQFQLHLPDGTKVWLNASSSLKYPVNFLAKERKVELRGEGYFEVEPDKKRPFKVLSQSQIVEVLGTHFNINTYSDEPSVKTTLVEGSVKISSNHISKILKPGEQSSINLSDMKISTVDVDQAVAWHNGDFAFEGTELKAIMRQVSRWYDVEVVYDGNIGEVKFGGSISRSKNISEVLKVLEMTEGVSFRLEGRRVLVMP